MNKRKHKVLSDEEAKKMKESIKRFSKRFAEDLERRHKKLFEYED